jgi:hypothetical protein
MSGCQESDVLVGMSDSLALMKIQHHLVMVVSVPIVDKVPVLIREMSIIMVLIDPDMFYSSQ